MYNYILNTEFNQSKSCSGFNVCYFFQFSLSLLIVAAAVEKCYLKKPEIKVPFLKGRTEAISAFIFV